MAGDDRFTTPPPREAQPDLLAGARDLRGEDLGGWRRGLSYLLGQFMTSDPRALEGIAQRIAPEAQTFRNERGESGIMLPDGRRFFLNRPGFTRTDMIGGVSNVAAGLAAAIPAARLAGMVGGGLLARMGIQGLAAAGQSAAMDSGAVALGSEQGVSAENAAVAGGAAAALEGGLPVIGRLALKVASLLVRTPSARLLDDAGQLTATFRLSLENAGINPSTLTGEQLTAISEALRQAGARQADEAAQLARTALARQAEGEFGIPTTRGQRTDDAAQLQTEDRLRGGGYGGGPRADMQAFDQQQRNAVERAGERVQQSVGGGDRALTEQEAGRAVGAAARDTYAAAKQAEDAAWNGFRQGTRPNEFIIAPEAVDGLRDGVERSIADFPVGENTPTARVVLDRLQRFGAGEGGAARQVSLVEVDGMRRLLANARPEAREDALAVGQIREAFGGWLDGLVDSGLTTGDEAAVEALRRAVGSSRQRFGLAQVPREAGLPESARRSVNERLLRLAEDRGATGQQIADWLYGQAALEAGGEQRRMLTQAMSGLLQGSEEGLAALRQGAILRMFRGATEDAGGYLRIANRMREALTGDGAELTAALFGGEQLATLGRLEAQLRTLARQRVSQNPSGSAFTLMGAAGTGGMAGVGALLAGLDPQLAMLIGGGGAATLGRLAGGGIRELRGEVAVRQATTGGAATTAAEAGGQAAEELLARNPFVRFLRRSAPGAGNVVADEVQ
jgi:hypothetical protein